MTDRRAYDPFAPHRPVDRAPADGEPVKAGPVAGDEQPEGEHPADLLPDDLDDISKPDLIALAEMADVATYGTKAEIAARIRESR